MYFEEPYLINDIYLMTKFKVYFIWIIFIFLIRFWNANYWKPLTPHMRTLQTTKNQKIR